ncbi:MAG: hypothetical protein SFV54_27450 [Bryobacteraceae bacterium]|nr:hypothetical protein [Bryobacteraceae bacterium]
MARRIVERIEAESGLPGLLDVLARGMAGADLQSLLLEVFRGRAAGQAASGLLVEKALAQPSDVDARLLNRVEACAFEAARGFEAVELSPVLPFASHALLGGIDQNNVLTALRGCEVSGDPSTGLAMEAARRRRRGDRAGDVRVCASQRVIRTQPFDQPGFSPHFKLFCLVTAGRDRGGDSFETESLAEHVTVSLRFFRMLNEAGFRCAEPLVEVTDHAVTEALLREAGVSLEEVRAKIRAHDLQGTARFLAERGLRRPEHGEAAPSERLARVEERVFGPLRAEFPEATFRLLTARLEGLGYYSGLCLRISPAAPDGVRYPVCDGGFVDWTARMQADRKERALASGIGMEFLCRRYSMSSALTPALSP